MVLSVFQPNLVSDLSLNIEQDLLTLADLLGQRTGCGRACFRQGTLANLVTHAFVRTTNARANTAHPVGGVFLGLAVARPQIVGGALLGVPGLPLKHNGVDQLLITPGPASLSALPQ